VFYYYLKDKPSSQISLELVDVNGKSIKKFTSRAQEKQASANPTGVAPAEQQQAATGEEEEEGPGVAVEQPEFQRNRE
jgi:ribosomal protein L12E/L44/L45/RPP1/RPP2